jgi:transcriptional regulator with XRE-family HTH domain
MPDKIKVAKARADAGLTQREAAELVHLSTPGRWAEYESGVRNMDAARWELFRLKVWLRGRKVKLPW